MKIGYLLDTNSGEYNRTPPHADEVRAFTASLLAEARVADEAGFDCLFIPERHVRTECVFPSPLLLLGMISAVTSRARLGTYILLLPLYEPTHIAEQVAVLESSSGRGFVLGLGVGWSEDYCNAFRIPMNSRRRRFEEGLEVMHRAWRPGTFTHTGEEFQYKNVGIFPKPHSASGPEVWIGGMVDQAIERAGRLGDAWCSDPFPIRLDTWSRQVSIYKEAAQRSGRRPYVVLMRDGWVAASREKAEAALGGVILDEYRTYFRWGLMSHHPEFRSESDINMKTLGPHLVIGSPDDCLKQLDYYNQTCGVDYVVMRFRSQKGPATQAVQECIQLFGEQVLSKMKTDRAMPDHK